jgi:tRNA threonylcarbamoyladenosine biosynthesis protein TsaB
LWNALESAMLRPLQWCPMRILALETSDKINSLAAVDGCNLLAELVLDRSQRSAQSLAPAMQSLLKDVGWQPSHVQLVAVSVGPGSFTGLRVGVTAAKVFAYAVGAEVLGLNTLEVIAANTQGTVPIVVSAKMGLSLLPAAVSVLIDAQRGEVVVQSFARQPDGSFAAIGPEELVDADAWLERVGRGQGEASNPQSLIPNPLVVTGPGLARLVDRLPRGVSALDEPLWHPRAAVVGQLAMRYHAQGRREDLWRLVPRYYRRSAAEEKWDARMTQT